MKKQVKKNELSEACVRKKVIETMDAIDKTGKGFIIVLCAKPESDGLQINGCVRVRDVSSKVVAGMLDKAFGDNADAILTHWMVRRMAESAAKLSFDVEGKRK